KTNWGWVLGAGDWVLGFAAAESPPIFMAGARSACGRNQRRSMAILAMPITGSMPVPRRGFGLTECVGGAYNSAPELFIKIRMFGERQTGQLTGGGFKRKFLEEKRRGDEGYQGRSG